MSNTLTVEQLIEQLGAYRKDAPVAIHNQTGLPFTYAVVGVFSRSNYDVSYLFDPSIGLPEDDCVYLRVEIVPGPPGAAAERQDEE